MTDDREKPATDDNRKGDYDVGYRKPPEHTRFKPGQSGNPRGKPKGAKGLKTDLREEMAERVTINEDGKSRKISKQRLMIKSMVQKAAKGDVRAQSAVLELVMRVFGVEDSREGKSGLSKHDQALLADFEKQLTNNGASSDGS
ncbi:hypothetical protein SAMN02745824_1532 [Parasphingorhabdus marina DSM 22363]|uniref:DUF5681 domain-containing protein n=1 Tax=Parasphingorhabdus marina DSM 22363 TaxID=1123272 RepID=A0A1N6D4N8_9SPHN|nr:DUF5681 domain-containing protein [Parasphingorhabdus marina]SIN65667.1 hypothetical protein SAMN02745824_1532 [Parasphingorhabdus marina DSM 22363]